MLDTDSSFILKYEYIINKVIWNNFSKIANEDNLYDELMQEGRFALLKARDTYIDGRQSFSSYAYRCIFNKISTYTKRYNNIKDNKNKSLNDLIDIKDNQEITYEDIFYTYDDLSKINSDYNDILKFISTFDIITKEIMFYTLNGYNQREISKILKINPVSINNRICVVRSEVSNKFNIKLRCNKTNGRVIAKGSGYYKEFKNLNEASKELQIDKSSIRKICQGIRKSAKSKTLNKKLNFEWGQDV